jgi:hypothetical protein
VRCIAVGWPRAAATEAAETAEIAEIAEIEAMIRLFMVLFASRFVPSPAPIAAAAAAARSAWKRHTVWQFWKPQRPRAILGVLHRRGTSLA